MRALRVVKGCFPTWLWFKGCGNHWAGRRYGRAASLGSLLVHSGWEVCQEFSLIENSTPEKWTPGHRFAKAPSPCHKKPHIKGVQTCRHLLLHIPTDLSKTFFFSNAPSTEHSEKPNHTWGHQKHPIAWTIRPQKGLFFSKEVSFPANVWLDIQPLSG